MTISVDAVSDRLQNIEQDGTQNYANHNEQFDTLNTFLPLQTKESAMEFDLLLDDAEIRKKLVCSSIFNNCSSTHVIGYRLNVNEYVHVRFQRKYLKNIGGNNAKESITRMLAKIFSVTFANSSSWCGQRGNFKVGDMKILSVIKGKNYYYVYFSQVLFKTIAFLKITLYNCRNCTRDISKLHGQVF